jgi:DNA-binding transcriptional LysR family regulator
MNLLHLHYFYSVAREGGFTKASQALGIRQPAISRMVAQLERDLGFKLFERQSRQVQLTNRGKEVFSQARIIFSEVENLKSSLGRISGECFGDLKFAAAEPIATELVPRALKRYCKTHPQVYPQFISGPASYLLDGIKAGALEFGAFFHLPDMPAGLAITDKIPLRFRLVVRTDLRADSAVTERFIGSREIDDTATRKFPTLEKWQKKKPKAQIRISTNNISSHRRLVLDGLGIAVLPDFLVARELKSGRLTDLMPSETLMFDLKIVARETATLSLNAARFIRTLKDLN